MWLRVTGLGLESDSSHTFDDLTLESQHFNLMGIFFPSNGDKTKRSTYSTDGTLPPVWADDIMVGMVTAM